MTVVTVSPDLLSSKDTILRSSCRAIDLSASADVVLAKMVALELFATLFSDSSAVGLAAPQIGFSLQVIAISYTDKDSGLEKQFALANPIMLSKGSEESTSSEFCLSVPGVSGRVSRSNATTLAAFDLLQETQIVMEAVGFLARVVQHEVDHLSGTLYTDIAAGPLASASSYGRRRAVAVARRFRLP